MEWERGHDAGGLEDYLLGGRDQPEDRLQHRLVQVLQAGCGAEAAVRPRMDALGSELVPDPLGEGCCSPRRDVKFDGECVAVAVALRWEGDRPNRLVRRTDGEQHADGGRDLTPVVRF